MVLLQPKCKRGGVELHKQWGTEKRVDQSTWTEQETTILASRAAFFRLPLGRLLAHLATLRTRRDSLFSSLDACRGENKGGVISGAYQPNPGPTKGAALANKPDRTGCRGKHAAHFSHPEAEKAAHTSAQPSHLELKSGNAHTCNVLLPPVDGSLNSQYEQNAGGGASSLKAEASPLGRDMRFLSHACVAVSMPVQLQTAHVLPVNPSHQPLE